MLRHDMADGTALMPTDRTGENPGKWNSKEPYYDDWYTVSAINIKMLALTLFLADVG
jgi:hypothetical protein